MPLNVDSERLFPDDPGGIAETVRLLAGGRAPAGCSIEDYDPARGAVVPVDEAVAAVARGGRGVRGRRRRADRPGRAPALRDRRPRRGRRPAWPPTGRRRRGGVRPGPVDEADIARVVEVGGPVNVLALPGQPPIERLAELGVRRISTGGALHNAATAALREQASRLVPQMAGRRPSGELG